MEVIPDPLLFNALKQPKARKQTPETVSPNRLFDVSADQEQNKVNQESPMIAKEPEPDQLIIMLENEMKEIEPMSRLAEPIDFE